jgi:hypothetical protein
VKGNLGWQLFTGAMVSAISYLPWRAIVNLGVAPAARPAR